MTLQDRRTETVAAHAYTVPVVREVPIRAGAGGATITVPEPLTYPGSTAW
jgi:hypothetical protein